VDGAASPFRYADDGVLKIRFCHGAHTLLLLGCGTCTGTKYRSSRREEGGQAAVDGACAQIPLNSKKTVINSTGSPRS
jgi:hypothetical protein